MTETNVVMAIVNIMADVLIYFATVGFFGTMGVLIVGLPILILVAGIELIEDSHGPREND